MRTQSLTDFLFNLMIFFSLVSLSLSSKMEMNWLVLISDDARVEAGSMSITEEALLKEIPVRILYTIGNYYITFTFIHCFFLFTVPLSHFHMIDLISHLSSVITSIFC